MIMVLALASMSYFSYHYRFH